MTTINFHTDEPGLFGLGIDHGAIGQQADSLMGHPAYLDANHPQHHQVMHEVRSRFHAIYGDANTGSSSYPTMTISTAPQDQGDKA